MKKVTKIVLAGGPGGGKSKSLKRLLPELEQYGYKVFPVLESATQIIESGFNRHESAYEFQKAIAENQLKIETEIEKNVKPGEKALIICDRGLMDCRVYLNDSDYEKIKAELNMNEVELRDRYDAVFHLDSTSNSSHAEYINEHTRIENESEARKINERSLKAWCGNPHYRFIPVCENYEEKFCLLLKEIKSFLGIPRHLEIERKFLIKYPDIDFLMTLPCSKTSIEQAYLIGEQGVFRLRKRGCNGEYIFIKTVKTRISDTVRIEKEDRLSESEYNELMSSNKVTGKIKKHRYCLMYKGTYYEIDIFPFWKNQALLEVEMNEENEEINIPEFFDLIREVSFDERYRNSSLCNNVPKEEV